MLGVLEHGLGSGGPDVLFQVVQFHGGTRAYERALASLRKSEVQARVTPPLRLALDLREAGCATSPALWQRAVTDGDERALVVLDAQRAMCKPLAERDTTFRRLNARLFPRAGSVPTASARPSASRDPSNPYSLP